MIKTFQPTEELLKQEVNSGFTKLDLGGIYTIVGSGVSSSMFPISREKLGHKTELVPKQGPDRTKMSWGRSNCMVLAMGSKACS